MTFDEYQTFTRSTAIYPKEYAIVYPALGLAGESGEVADKIKKKIRDGKFDLDALVKELGDVLWYVSQLASDLDVPMSEVVKTNVDKLKSRQERNALQGSGDNR